MNRSKPNLAHVITSWRTTNRDKRFEGRLSSGAPTGVRFVRVLWLMFPLFFSLPDAPRSDAAFAHILLPLIRRGLVHRSAFWGSEWLKLQFRGSAPPKTANIFAAIGKSQPNTNTWISPKRLKIEQNLQLTTNRKSGLTFQNPPLNSTRDAT